MTTKLISVVMPALNEVDAIADLVRAIPRDKLAELGFETEVIVVDNGSTDGTGKSACEAGARVVQEKRRGYGRAYKAGFRSVKGDVIFCLDADSTYPPESIPELLSLMETRGLEFITTTRFRMMEPDAMSLSNRLGNRTLSFICGLLFGLSMEDSQSGMWAIRKSLLDALQLNSNGMALSQEIKIKACQRASAWQEVPISYQLRVGKVKLRRWRDGLGNLAALLRLKFLPGG